MDPFGAIGDLLGGGLKGLAVSTFVGIMRGIWKMSLFVLREAFGLADRFSIFTIDTHSGPVSVMWPMMLWISVTLALGLFFWQMISTALRGGRGFIRLVTGPMQYGVALAMTVGMGAAFLAAADGLTHGILQAGLQTENFDDALTHTSFGDGAYDAIDGVALGFIAIAGVFPSAIGFGLEMVFREAAIYLMAATVPIVAAGLLAKITAVWFWRTCRWLLACILMKPVLALIIVLGVAIAGGAQGLSGLLAGVAVLVISLWMPFLLFRLLAFVDPNTDPGAGFRDFLASEGVDSYGGNNPAQLAMDKLTGGGKEDKDAGEDANTDRFDAAEAGAQAAAPEAAAADAGAGAAKEAANGGDAEDDGRDAGESETGEAPGDELPTPGVANHGRVVSSSSGTGPTGDYSSETPAAPRPPEGSGSSAGGDDDGPSADSEEEESDE